MPTTESSTAAVIERLEAESAQGQLNHILSDRVAVADRPARLSALMTTVANTPQIAGNVYSLENFLDGIEELDDEGRERLKTALTGWQADPSDPQQTQTVTMLVALSRNSRPSLFQHFLDQISTGNPPLLSTLRKDTTLKGARAETNPTVQLLAHQTGNKTTDARFKLAMRVDTVFGLRYCASAEEPEQICGFALVFGTDTARSDVLKKMLSEFQKWTRGAKILTDGSQELQSAAITLLQAMKQVRLAPEAFRLKRFILLTPCLAELEKIHDDAVSATVADAKQELLSGITDLLNSQKGVNSFIRKFQSDENSVLADNDFQALLLIWLEALMSGIGQNESNTMMQGLARLSRTTSLEKCGKLLEKFYPTGILGFFWGSATLQPGVRLIDVGDQPRTLQHTYRAQCLLAFFDDLSAVLAHGWQSGQQTRMAGVGLLNTNALQDIASGLAVTPEGQHMYVWLLSALRQTFGPDQTDTQFPELKPEWLSEELRETTIIVLSAYRNLALASKDQGALAGLECMLGHLASTIKGCGPTNIDGADIDTLRKYQALLQRALNSRLLEIDIEAEKARLDENQASWRARVTIGITRFLSDEAASWDYERRTHQHELREVLERVNATIKAKETAPAHQ